MLTRTLTSLSPEDAKKEFIENRKEELKAVFESMGPILLYRGIVDDPRNTDDAWMETEAYLIDVSDKKATKSAMAVDAQLVAQVRSDAVNGRAGDDSRSVRWLDLNEAAEGRVSWSKEGKMLKLNCCYASHFA